MKFLLTKATQRETSYWAGGKSTELFIYPPSASYAERNFICRISTATVECQSSVFTLLPQVRRQLVLLQGEIELEIEGNMKKHLIPFDEPYCFLGDNHTVSYGECVDFNIMLKGSAAAEIESVLSSEEGKKVYAKTSVCAVYAPEKVSITADDELFFLDKGDFIVFYDIDKLYFISNGEKNVRSLVSHLFLPDEA